MSYTNVTETQYRPQQFVEQVPITTYSNVTVDRGQYKMVWVPNPVVQQVPRTIMTQQVRTRMVPQQVVRQVPQVSTQYVPVQTVQQVPVMGGCNTCGGYSMMAPSNVFYPPSAAVPIQGVPTTAGWPMSQPPMTSQLPTLAEPQWEPIHSHPGHPQPGTSDRSQVPMPDDGSAAIPPGTPQIYHHSAERPVTPSAAAAWQARGVFR